MMTPQEYAQCLRQVPPTMLYGETELCVEQLARGYEQIYEDLQSEQQAMIITSYGLRKGQIPPGYWTRLPEGTTALYLPTEITHYQLRLLDQLPHSRQIRPGLKAFYHLDGEVLPLTNSFISLSELLAKSRDPCPSPYDSNRSEEPLIMYYEGCAYYRYCLVIPFAPIDMFISFPDKWGHFFSERLPGQLPPPFPLGVTVMHRSIREGPQLWWHHRQKALLRSNEVINPFSGAHRQLFRPSNLFTTLDGEDSPEEEQEESKLPQYWIPL